MLEAFNLENRGQYPGGPHKDNKMATLLTPGIYFSCLDLTQSIPDSFLDTFMGEDYYLDIDNQREPETTSTQ